MNATPWAAITDTGRVRAQNEDAIFAEPPVFAVADGVGGAASGEDASKIALEILKSHFQDLTGAASSDEALSFFETTVLHANSRIYSKQKNDPDRAGMATTFTGALVRPGGEVLICHVGDSRAYALRPGGPIRQLTEDHSIVAELVRSGKITADEAESHPRRNVITRAVGCDPDVATDTIRVVLAPGEWLLLASDGLTGLVSDEEIAQILGVELNKTTQRSNLNEAAAKACQVMVDAANDAGGTDNISVVLARPLAPFGDDFEAQNPAEISGALPVIPLDEGPVTNTGEMPAVDPKKFNAVTGTNLDATPLDHRTQRRRIRAKKTSSRKPLLIIVMVALVAFGIGAGAWSQSYFLVEREGGLIGIDHGFPLPGLHVPWRTSDVNVEDLERSDRNELVGKTVLRSRADALKEYERLPELAGRCDEEDTLGDPGCD